MKCLVTGSTGFIGNRLTNKLLSLGWDVHVLVRTPEKAEVFHNGNVRIFKGDLADPESVRRSMAGCTHVFHLAALAKASISDPGAFIRINIDGTRNILEAALLLKVKRVVFTSTAGILSPSGNDTDIDEASEKPQHHLTEYARTKYIAGQLCLEYVKKGLEVVITLPSRVYGPGILNESNSMTKIMSAFIKGKWHLIPGDGQSFGNYVFIEDVVDGHLAAMERGQCGEFYILGGENLTFNRMFAILSEVNGTRPFMIRIPASLLIGVTRILVFLSGAAGKELPLTPVWIKRYLQHRRLSSEKAIRELDYVVTPFREGVRKTIEWLN